CRENSLPGYFGPTAESLGLCCRTWYGHLLPQVSRRLAVLDPEASEYFWHGAGRSMYFSPLNMFPGSPPWFAAESEPPDDISRRNARSGAAWAFTVVNCQTPEVIAYFLSRKGDQVAGNDAFAEGVFSTLVMAGDMYPGHKYIPAFCNYQPEASMADAWTQRFGTGFLDKVNHYRDVLRANDKLGEVFRYQPLSTLVPSLEAAAAPKA
ncbi:MAG TPA: hypothetical protein VNH18_31790, partial [Bryobacteraceae bacterium]|nr:hypothetical protein [Bryobacteraceae bacterium]